VYYHIVSLCTLDIERSPRLYQKSTMQQKEQLKSADLSQGRSSPHRKSGSSMDLHFNTDRDDFQNSIRSGDFLVQRYVYDNNFHEKMITFSRIYEQL